MYNKNYIGSSQNYSRLKPSILSPNHKGKGMAAIPKNTKTLCFLGGVSFIQKELSKKSYSQKKDVKNYPEDKNRYMNKFGCYQLNQVIKYVNHSKIVQWGAMNRQYPYGRKIS